MAKTIITSEWFNALYGEDGDLEQDGKPEYLDAETLARTMPDAAIYSLPDDVYDDLLDGAGYPPKLSDVPLSRCTQLR